MGCPGGAPFGGVPVEPEIGPQAILRVALQGSEHFLRPFTVNFTWFDRSMNMQARFVSAPLRWLISMLAKRVMVLLGEVEHTLTDSILMGWIILLRIRCDGGFV